MKIKRIAFPTQLAIVFEPAAREYIAARAYAHARDITSDKIDFSEGDTPDDIVSTVERIKEDLRRTARSFEAYALADADTALQIPATELDFLAHICQPPPEDSVLTTDELKEKLSFRVWRFMSALKGVAESMEQPSVPDVIVHNLSEACHDRMNPELAELAAQSPTGAVRINSDGVIVPHMGDVPENLAPLGDAGFGVVREGGSHLTVGPAESKPE